MAAVFLSVAGCTLPSQGRSGNNHDISIASPSPPASPSPSPTAAQAFAAITPTFHAGEVGVDYPSVPLGATGGVQPYHWAISGGALPTGLTIGNDGALSGKPTTAGKFSFSIEITDSSAGKAAITGTITIASALNAALVPACAQQCSVELGCTNACGNFGAVTGGLAPFTTQLVQGQLPAGTSLSGLSLLGTFTGLTGFLQFTVRVNDSLGGTATVSPTFWMYPHISLAGGATCYGNYVTGCSATLGYSGGTPGSVVSVTLVALATNSTSNPPNNNPGMCWSSPPPSPGAGWLSAGGGAVRIAIPPAPEPNADGYGAVWTVEVTSTDVCGPGTRCASNKASVVIGVQCG